MDLTDIVKTRLFSHHIMGTRFTTVKDLVGWMGAMQAQDYYMMKWAVGLRLPGVTFRDVDTAIDKGEILRTHVLRPTWHLVSAEDVYWMLALTAPQIKTSLKSRHAELELTDTNLHQSNEFIREALSGGKQLTREELLDEFKRVKIAINDNRASHLLLWAELEGIICSGASKMGKPTYALLEERVPQSRPISREEALTLLAKKYFSSRGPATLQDFEWWSGLSVIDAKQALERIKPDLGTEVVSSETYWYSNQQMDQRQDEESAFLLPSFDEYIIGYSDRRAILPHEKFNKLVSNNGVFRPVLVENGQVTGIWKRTIAQDKVRIEIDLFKSPDQKDIDGIETAALQYDQFIEKETEVACFVKA